MVEKFGIGQPVRRKEDVRLLTGRGTYTDDLDRPGQAHAFVLRSPHAHARIVSMDTAAARAAPGVLAVLTGQDAEADGIGHFPVMVEVPGRDGEKLWPTPRPILQTTKVRFVGDPVALVVAETRQEAQDAAELIEVEYDLLPSVTDTAAADRDDAPPVWEERGSNLCVHWSSGREAEADAAFERAARTVQVELVNNRLVGNPMEPRVAIGEFDPATERLHPALADPGRDPGAGRAGAARARGAEGQAARGLARCRRRLRAARQAVPGERHGALGGEAGRPAGEVAERPLRDLRLRPARARPRDPGGDGLRRGRPRCSACGYAPSPRWAPTCRISGRASRRSRAGASTARSTTSRR